MLDLETSHKNGNHCAVATLSIVQRAFHPLRSPFVVLLLKECILKRIIEVSQNEQNENGNVDGILDKEVESWNDFRYALREENALLFGKMLSECGQNKDYIRAAVSKDEN
jgi:hypothetical protein